MNHRYKLEEYKGPGSRYDCPACHQKRVFARYIDTETGQHISPDVGRCNREDKCGYHYTPSQYFKDHPENRSEYRPDDTGYSHKKSAFSNAIKKDENQHISIDTIPGKYVSQYLGYNSDFVRFLLSLFDHYFMDCPTIQRLMSEYYLGCTGNGSVIFWQIDSQNRIRTGKIMRYNPDTGKRIKKESGAIDWMHAKMKRAGMLIDSWTLSQCLFGEHLLRKRPEDTVCLVEGEKSAVIGSGFMPEYIWLATGGKQNLKSEKCECLKGRNVVLFPDLGAFDAWKEKGESIARKVGFSLSVSDILEEIATGQERENGYDIADYLIRCRRDRIQKQMQFVCGPQYQMETVPPPTKEERILQSMAAVNPILSNLINALDLVTKDGHKPRVN